MVRADIEELAAEVLERALSLGLRVPMAWTAPGTGMTPH